jgi:hypothetical protein
LMETQTAPGFCFRGVIAKAEETSFRHTLSTGVHGKSSVAYVVRQDG